MNFWVLFLFRSFQKFSAMEMPEELKGHSSMATWPWREHENSTDHVNHGSSDPLCAALCLLGVFPSGSDGKETSRNVRSRFNPWVNMITQRREWQPIQYSGSQEHGQVQFSSLTQSRPTLSDPMDCGTPGFPVYHQLSRFTQTHVHRVSDAIQPSHPLSSSSPTFNLSQNEDLF